MAGRTLAISHVAMGEGSLNIAEKSNHVIAKLAIDPRQLNTCLKFDIFYKKRTLDWMHRLYHLLFETVMTLPPLAYSGDITFHSAAQQSTNMAARKKIR